MTSRPWSSTRAKNFATSRRRLSARGGRALSRRVRAWGGSPSWCAGHGSRWLDHELRLQDERVGSTVPLVPPQLQDQLERAQPALSAPPAVLHDERFQLERAGSMLPVAGSI